MRPLWSYGVDGADSPDRNRTDSEPGAQRAGG